MLDSGLTVVLPRTLIKAVYGLPERLVDVHGVQDQLMQLRWTFPDAYIRGERLQFNVVRNQLTQNIPRLTRGVAAEIRFGFLRSWGESTGWKEVRVWTSALRIVAGAANGAFCGPPLCRDVVFLDRMKDHAMTIFLGALLLNCLPRALHPILGPIFSCVSGFAARRATRRSLPVVTERLAKTAQWKANPDTDWTPPEDALQWVIDECYTSKDPEAQLLPTRVCQRLLFVNDISMLTTAYAAQNLLLDLFSTDPALRYAETLRQECETALRNAGGEWTHAAVQELRLVDSALRESMRMSPFGTLGLPREAIHPAGIQLGDTPVRLPSRTCMALPLEAIHYDETIYPHATRYDPFRFVTRQGVAEPRVKSTATLDDSFLAFGVPGKWACPGRFFALLELKIFVAELLLNYEVEYLKERPKPIYMMWSRYPPDVKIQVRRRGGCDPECVQGGVASTPMAGVLRGH
ncbi:hypothetical protein PMIN03_005991 [Paraphaeosphaeria minitans]